MNELNQLLIEIEKQVIYLKDRLINTDKKCEKLLKFVKEIAENSCELYPCRATFAKDLLKEIGE